MDHRDPSDKPTTHPTGLPDDWSPEDFLDGLIRSGEAVPYRTATADDGTEYLRRIAPSQAVTSADAGVPMEWWEGPHTEEQRCEETYQIVTELLHELGAKVARVDWGPVDPIDPFHTALTILLNGPLGLDEILALDRDQLYTFLAAATGTFVHLGPEEAMARHRALRPKFLEMLEAPLLAPPDWDSPFECSSSLVPDNHD